MLCPNGAEYGPTDPVFFVQTFLFRLTDGAELLHMRLYNSAIMTGAAEIYFLGQMLLFCLVKPCKDLGPLRRSAMKRLIALAALAAMSLAGSARACCSVAKAELTNTRGYVGVAKKNGKTVHILAYQNDVQNLAPGGNAMLLPIPARPGSMTDANLIDTSAHSRFLDDIVVSVIPPPPSLKKSEGATCGTDAFQAAIQVFNKGIYTVVLADHARDIPSALGRVPREKRPPINSELFKAYDKWYPGYTFALCCFNNTGLEKADPLFWWYEPMNPRKLFFPAVDCHTGKVPDLRASVKVDHALIVSLPEYNPKMPRSFDLLGGLFGWSPNLPIREIQYSDRFQSEIQKLLPQFAMGKEFRTMMKQGDFVFNLSDLEKGEFAPSRDLPPGA